MERVCRRGLRDAERSPAYAQFWQVSTLSRENRLSAADGFVAGHGGVYRHPRRRCPVMSSARTMSSVALTEQSPRINCPVMTLLSR
ncbi:hypothetical protein SKAU_G00322670 [Synaphobranchus kaupii]|uniref:Uncharacterized protein n=1 Tax=Synaphobranchus kaupii TaxID=118154 RepID=A0A9Q1EP35_SYNKA|nr:hypothetical protein SKAU_G00322670 [Synaphobranchus kaupii]